MKKTISSLDLATGASGLCLMRGDRMALILIEVKGDLGERLEKIGRLMRSVKTRKWIVESTPFHGTSAPVLALAHGILIGAGHKELGINPLALKRAMTGDGKAEKKEMINAVSRFLSLELNDNLADAASLALLSLVEPLNVND